MRAKALALFEMLAPRLPGVNVMGQRTDPSLRRGHVFLRLQRLPDAAQAVAPMQDRPAAGGCAGPRAAVRAGGADGTGRCALGQRC